MHQRPAHQDSTGDLPATFSIIRNSTSQSAVSDRTRNKDLNLLDRGSLDVGTRNVGTADVASEHQSEECWVFDAAANVGTRYSEQSLPSIIGAGDFAAHACRQRLESRC